MKFHEYANLFPMLGDAEIQALADDIRENGLRTPIVTFESQILDGRNRYCACEVAGVDPVFEEYLGGDPLSFVVSHNLHRRHLTESQRGMVAARLATLKHGGDRKSDDIKSPIGDLILSRESRQEAAAQLNVGTTTLDRARRVQRDGAPEVIAAVEAGDLKLGTALVIATLPEDEQREVIAAGPEAIKTKAKELREESKSPQPPANPSPKGRIKIVHEDGNHIFATARSIMDRINSKDIHREKALNSMISYCQSRINENR